MTIKNYGEPVPYTSDLTLGECEERFFQALKRQAQSDMLAMRCLACARNPFECVCTAQDIDDYLTEHPVTIRYPVR